MSMDVCVVGTRFSMVLGCEISFDYQDGSEIDGNHKYYKVVQFQTSTCKYVGAMCKSTYWKLYRQA